MPPPGKDIAPAVRRLRTGQKEPIELGVALSVNGNLQSVYEPVAEGAERPVGYKPVAIGEPLLVRYLRFDIITQELTSDVDQILISTFLKVEETKQAAGELFTYYDPTPSTSGPKQRYVLKDFAPANFGHELIMYTPAYTGETIRLGTRIWELDSPNKPLFKALRGLISGAATLPIFADLLPLSVTANQTLSIIESLVQFLNKDDSVFNWEGIALYDGLDNSPRLQAGRYVVTPTVSSAALIEAGRYKLTTDNVLLRNGQPVQDVSYIVFQVSNVRRNEYKGFNHALGAADIMRRINRPGSEDSEAAKDIVLAAMGALNDRRAIEQIQELAPTAKSDPESKTKIQALQKNLTSASAAALSPWIDKIVGG